MRDPWKFLNGAISTRRRLAGPRPLRGRRYYPRVNGLEGRVLLSDGMHDMTFGNRGIVTIDFSDGANRDDTAEAMAVQPDGKIVLVGSTVLTNADFAVVRLNPDGSFDKTFSGDSKAIVAFDLGGNFHDEPADVAIQPDGKIVIVGYTERTAAGNYDFAVARLNADGSLDGTFGINGKATVAFDLGDGGDDSAFGVAIQRDGKIVVVGEAQRSAFGNYDFAAARLNVDGSLDATFGVGGKAIVDFDRGGDLDDGASGVALQADGKIVLAGSARGSSRLDFAAARLNVDGSLDATFGVGGKAIVDFGLEGAGNDIANAVAIQADGKIVLAGSTSSSDERRFAVARLNTDGSPDTSFSKDGERTIGFAGSHDSIAYAMATAPEGKIVLAGANYLYPFPMFAVARLNADGSLDPSFDNDGMLTTSMGGIGEVKAVAVLPDGRILAAATISTNSQGTLSDILVMKFGPTSIPPNADTLPPRILSARLARIKVKRRRKTRAMIQVVVRFSEGMNASLAGQAGLFLVAEARKKQKKVVFKTVLMTSATYDATSRETTLTLAGKPLFKKGGQVTAMPPLSDQAGNLLEGDADGGPGPAPVVPFR